MAIGLQIDTININPQHVSPNLNPHSAGDLHMTLPRSLRWIAAGALGTLGLTAAVLSVQAAGPVPGPSVAGFVPLGVAATDGKNTTAWFLDTVRNRVVYCTTAGSLSGAPQCESGPIPSK